jgi:hypothetical protein
VAAKIFGVMILVVGCVALADLVANPSGTKVLTGAGISAEQSALNAELGKTS